MPYRMTKVRSVAAGGDAALGVSQFSTNRIAKRFIAEGRLKSEGSKRGRRYVSVS